MAEDHDQRFKVWCTWRLNLLTPWRHCGGACSSTTSILLTSSSVIPGVRHTAEVLFPTYGAVCLRRP